MSTPNKKVKVSVIFTEVNEPRVDDEYSEEEEEEEGSLNDRHTNSIVDELDKIQSISDLSTLLNQFEHDNSLDSAYDNEDVDQRNPKTKEFKCDRELRVYTAFNRNFTRLLTTQSSDTDTIHIASILKDHNEDFSL